VAPGFASGNLPTAAPTAAAANTTTGTVKLVDGDTVYITTSDGRTITVKTSGSTAVQTTQGGSLGDLAAGSTVTVQGQTRSDGPISASAITKAKGRCPSGSDLRGPRATATSTANSSGRVAPTGSD